MARPVDIHSANLHKENVLKILAIETSCDETAAAVVEKGREVLSSVIYSQIEEHKLYGGVVPEIASRRHTEQILPVTHMALEQAGVTFQDIDAVAVTAAPGLIGALLVGVSFAKGLCIKLEKPLIAVHHIRGHIAANYIAHKNLEPPFICLIVSGGHSHIVDVKSYTDFRVIGKTRDDAAGEAFDKVARVLGLSYPGGVNIDKAAQSGNSDAYKLPRPRVDGSPYDFSFSGLKTSVINLVHNVKQKGGSLSEVEINDIAASFQSTACEILTSRFINAANEFKYKKLVLAGGVSANSRLRDLMGAAADEKGYELYMPPLSLCGDNAAMIGAQAWFEYKAGHTAVLDLNAYATWPVENNFEQNARFYN